MDDDKKPKGLFGSFEFVEILVIAIIALGILGALLVPAGNIIQNISGFSQEGGFTSIKFVLQAIFIPVDIFLFVFLVVTLRKIFALDRAVATGEPRSVPPPPQEQVHAAWEQIETLAASANPSEWNMAVIRADALLDDLLLHRGYGGPTFADRLRIVDPTILRSRDRVWSAHRLRNMIAHEPTQTHTHEMIMHALAAYEGAFQELGYREAVPPVPADPPDAAGDKKEPEIL
ncbi:MAG: hypothetical protein Q8Q94_01460 [bacterium]|nr:hypothetical protein [bacterium]MDZ4299725.1 hypothetical protein [Candidatus Sungbacteria bacterium]